MIRRAGPWPAVALVVVLLAGGCGIPDDTDVVPVGVVPSAGVVPGSEDQPIRNNREDTTDRSTFVKYFLEAAAGDPAGAVARVKQFLSPSAQATFKAAAPIHVIRPVDEPLINPGSDDITFQAQQVGVLDGNGILTPSPDGATTPYSMTVQDGTSGKTGLFVTKAPQVLLLSAEALSSFYETRTIYFWNSERTALVPDIRYMPTSMPFEQRPTEILRWLTAGPSPLISSAVEALPEGTAVIGNVPAISNDKLQINLTGQAVAPDDKEGLDRLRRQLMWSLRLLLPKVLELKVVGHNSPVDYEGTDHYTSNASYALTEDPERFAIYNGEIKRLKRSAYPGRPVPVLQPGANRNVRFAAFSTSNTETYAAVVTNEGGGSLRVASARTNDLKPLAKVALSGQLGHPVWAVTPDEPEREGTGLITANGRLYSFGAEGGTARRVEWPGGGTISAVAVAPDAHRVAAIVNGSLYLAVLVTGGEGLQVSAQPQPVWTPMRTLTAVDWSSEGWLVVGGVRAATGRVAIMDISIDGAQQSERLRDLGSVSVTHLSAYPQNPVEGRQNADAVAYVARGAAYDALVDPTPITVGELAVPPADRPAGVSPTEPFFLR
jgi:hypothetical protein